MSKNRFAGLQAVKQLQNNKQIQSNQTPEIKEVVQLQTKAELKNDNTVVAPKRGRPNGKRSNVDFQQVTAYVRRNTYRRVSIKLLDQEIKGEFSELIENLLQKWLED